jgi:hypothetical protein
LQVILAGNWPLAPASNNVHVESADALRHADLSATDLLVVDRGTFDAARADPAFGAKLNGFASHRPLTVVGASLSDLGLKGNDTASAPAAVVATSVLRVGGVTFSHEAAWSAQPTAADIVADGTAWYGVLQTKFSHYVSQAYVPGGWTLKYSTSYSYTSAPYGTVGYEADWYRQTSESDPSYDYWVVVFQTTSNPGANLWGNSWNTYATWVYSNVNYYSYDPYLYSAQPGSTCCTDYATYSIGIPSSVSGGPSYIQNWYYINSVVTAYQESTQQQYNSYFQVEHDMAHGSWAAYSSFTSQPAAEFRVSQGNCLQIPYTNQAEWQDYSTGNTQQSWINSWRQVCP